MKNPYDRSVYYDILRLAARTQMIKLRGLWFTETIENEKFEEINFCIQESTKGSSANEVLQDISHGSFQQKDDHIISAFAEKKGFEQILKKECFIQKHTDDDIIYLSYIEEFDKSGYNTSILKAKN